MSISYQEYVFKKILDIKQLTRFVKKEY